MARAIACVCIALFVAGLAGAAGIYAGAEQPWPVRPVRRLIAVWRDDPVQVDGFSRLLRWPGKREIACPAQDGRTAVLVVAGQSNAGNFQGQPHQGVSDHVVNFLDGHCYRAESPLLGADGKFGETWTLLGNRLVTEGVFSTVVIAPATAGGSPIARWAQGGDLNGLLVSVIRAVKARYAVTGVLWDQGAQDYGLRTPEGVYRAALLQVIGTVRAAGVRAPFFVTRCSMGDAGGGWREDNPVSRAEASVANAAENVFDGPDTDHDLTPFDRYDGYHFAASGQDKYVAAWLPLLRAHPGL
jgi:hypothetical protein